MKNTNKKRMYNLTEFILQALFLVSIYVIPFGTIDRFNSAGSATISDHSAAVGDYAGYLLVIFSFLNAIICLVSVFSNSSDKDGKTHVIFPIITLFFGCMLLFGEQSTPTDIDDFIIIIHPLYKIICLLIMLTNIVLAILKRKTSTSGKTQQTLKNDTVSTEIPAEESETKTETSYDDIKKLKELLDIGAITQEEFESKKKELLNI